MIKLIVFSLLFITSALANYPEHWWKPVPEGELASWEIGPQAAGDGEVVLSKRNELGTLSNFAATPFELDGKTYPGVEALWQSMKFPEGPKDPRAALADWKYTRVEVEKMDGFAAKKAGSHAKKIMKEHNINWVTYQGKKMTYRTSEKGDHYKVILKAMKAKLDQNKEVKDILKQTGDLVLLPDHKTKPTDPPAWKYYKIWMELRDQL